MNNGRTASKEVAELLYDLVIHRLVVTQVKRLQPNTLLGDFFDKQIQVLEAKTSTRKVKRSQLRV